MPPPRKSVMSERQQMQMILQMSGDSKSAAAAAAGKSTTPGTTTTETEDTSSTGRPIAQHAKKSIPVELKNKQQSSDDNDDNLMSSSSNTKEEASISLKETTKSEESQQSTLMSTKEATDKSQSGTPSPQNSQLTGTKRTFAEIENSEETTPSNSTEAEETKRKKRKDGNTSNSQDSSKEKETKPSGPGNKSNVQQKNSKQSSASNQNAANTKGGNSGSAPSSLDGKSPCGSPKVAVSGSTEGDVDDVKDVPKVPPLKIVIPSSLDNDNGHGGNPRNGKNSSARNAPLPYVVTSSNSNDAIDKADSTSRCNSPADSTKGNTEEKTSNSGKSSEEGGTGGTRGQQRVLRSSNRNAERSSNNSSPQMQGNNSSSVSPAPKEDDATKTNESNNAKSTSPANNSTDDSNATNTTETDAASTSQTHTTTTTTTTSNEIHPRKRKLKSKQEDANNSKTSTVTNQANETTSNTNANTTTDHPHDHPFTNCYQMFMDIRKQIEQKHKNILPIQPKPPQGFSEYLMNRKSYLLAGKAPPEDIQVPSDVSNEMKDLFTNQERERVKLKLRHIVEKEKLGLCVEQEILRVHAKAARSLANQSVPYSACTMLKDEEIYNVITPEQEEKDRNARSRYNGRLFLSWLQDVDDKWEKIKEAMILRHHNEAESLHAVQRMDWEFALVEKGLHGFKIHPDVKDEHVPIVPVSDEFDLLPA